MKPLLHEVRIDAPVEAVYAQVATLPYSIFLDSAMNAGGQGRYSFIAYDPFLIFSCKDSTITLRENGNIRTFSANPFSKLKSLLAQYHSEKFPDMPPLCGGAIGYFSYDMGYLLEKIPGYSQDDLHIDDCCFGFYDTVFIYDHERQQAFIAATGFPEQSEPARRARAEARLAAWQIILDRVQELPEPAQPHPQETYCSNFTADEYGRMVQQGIDYITAGDIFEVNLSQRFEAVLTVPPFELYRYLRKVNPAPFASYLNFGEVVIASASPERYLLVKGKNVETRPIKGTRPRGKDAAADMALRNELLTSEKDRAELVMIIDLERNDLGRVCRYGSVKVPDLIRLEEYATVFHLVSTVTGELEGGKDVIDLVMASFPGGSITGAPKVRAMEIIDELEPFRRSIYTGSIGYLDFNGDADLNIVIRTFILKGGRAYFQVGGAIVADSVPSEEYQETLDKARALMQALGYQV